MLMGVLTTYGNFFTYGLAGFFEVKSSPVKFNEIEYANYPLRNCSVRSLRLLQLNQPIASLDVLFPIHIGLMKALVACNTSIDQYLVLNVARKTYKDPRIGYGNPRELTNVQTPLNIREALGIWAEAEGALLDLFAPLLRSSLFYPVVNMSNLSLLSLTFSGTYLPG